MGNAPSSTERTETTYDDYIQQQQDLIIQQQQQINNLYKMNLEQERVRQQQQERAKQHHNPYEQVPPNMRAERGYDDRFQNVPQLPPSYQGGGQGGNQGEPKQQLNPYKILNLSKNFTEEQLKKAYLKKAMKAHPDRGGSKDEFQKISIAYTVLKKKLTEVDNSHDHNQMKGGASNYMETQGGDESLKLDRENFDTAVFNKIYEENRVGEAYDGGYGDWIQESSVKDVSQKRMFNGEFNSEMFNHEFEKYKGEQAQKQGSQMVQYQEPEVSISMKNKDSLMSLGQGQVSDFSGETGNLGYRDYKDAFTNTTLIHTGAVSIEDRKGSLKGMERERSNISYRMSPEDQRRQAEQEMKAKQEEQQRLQRLQVYDQQSADMYDRIHKRLLQ
jgi:curved DNA-binding protein CbpA